MISGAEEVVAEPLSIRWVSWQRYSARQKAAMDLGGLVGKVCYRGQLEELLLLLVFGWLVHVGKDATFGLGQYRFVLQVRHLMTEWERYAVDSRASPTIGARHGGVARARTAYPGGEHEDSGSSPKGGRTALAPNTSAGLYDFQRRVAENLLSGRNVILQAPTGSGKTWAALYPFFAASEHRADFPRQCIYSVPVRVLANQFYSVCRQAPGNLCPHIEGTVTIQTGDQPADPEFLGDLVFTTIDQTLSSLLGVPYSVRRSRSNLNAGAVIWSYLVFDEFHLFPLVDVRRAEGALVTTLQLLRLLSGVTPFTLMTATFSTSLLDCLCEVLHAEKVTVSAQELAKIPSQKDKRRQFRAVEGTLSADSILDQHGRRSIVVCNQVESLATGWGAIRLFQDLLGRGCKPVPFQEATGIEDVYRSIFDTPKWQETTWVILLHSRFERAHRALKEEFVRREFGPQKTEWRVPSLILVGTQVVEVGLDITSENLHTEIAPANAVLQRAGRCARFPRETGTVWVYDVPDTSGNRYAPYTGVDAELCARAWAVFLDRDGAVLTFSDEQAVIDEVHTPGDEQLMEAMQARETELWGQVCRAVGLGDIAQRRSLIRKIDNRTVVVSDELEAIRDPYSLRGFSVWQGTLRGVFPKLAEWATEAGLDWAVKYPVEIGPEEDGGGRWEWRRVESRADLEGHALLVVNPRLVTYDALCGLRFAPSDGRYRSPVEGERKTTERYTYRKESWREHVSRMVSIFDGQLRERTFYTMRRLENKLNLEPGTLERATRLAIVLHDLGKLNAAWQAWARAYQQAIGEPTGEHEFLAHTHRSTSEHEERERSIRPGRPPHAGEGAIASVRLVRAALPKWEALWRAVVGAVARHHSPDCKGFGPYTIAEGLEELQWALVRAGVHLDEARRLVKEVVTRAPQSNLQNHVLRLPPADGLLWWVVYFIMVRIMRLCDGMSQTMGE